MQLFSACGGSRAGAGTDTSGGAWLPADLLAGGVLLAEALFAFASMTQFGVIFLYRDYKGDLASCDWQGFVNGLVRCNNMLFFYYSFDHMTEDLSILMHVIMIIIRCSFIFHSIV